MKRILLWAAMLLALGGCNGSGGSGSAANGDGTASIERELAIGVSIPAADHGWTAGAKYWAEQAMAMYPDVKWRFETAVDSAEQIADIDTMLVQGIDAIVILATESAPLTPKAKELADRGVFIVNVDRGFLEPVADIFIEGDNAAFGRKAAEFIVERLGGSGKIIILEGIPSTVNTTRVESASKVFSKYPGIEILASQSGDWNRQTAYEVTQALLLANPEVDMIWAADDDMALGAEQALREAGRAEDVWIIGGGGMKDIVKRVMDGDPMYPADVTYPPSMTAYGIYTAVSALRDGNLEQVMKFTPRHIVLDVDLITPENAERYYFPDSVY